MMPVKSRSNREHATNPYADYGGTALKDMSQPMPLDVKIPQKSEKKDTKPDDRTGYPNTFGGGIGSEWHKGTRAVKDAAAGAAKAIKKIPIF
jgi:hypothetical protein